LPAKHSIKRRADRSYADTVRDMSLTLDASSVDPDKPSLIEPSESDPSEESPDDEGGPPPKKAAQPESEAEKGKLPAKHSIKRRADRSYADTAFSASDSG
jgi:hypothetical protein